MNNVEFTRNEIVLLNREDLHTPLHVTCGASPAVVFVSAAASDRCISALCHVDHQAARCSIGSKAAVAPGIVRCPQFHCRDRPLTVL